MIKVNLNAPILNLDGEMIKQEGSAEVATAAKMAAQVLAVQTKGDALKLSEWARAFHKGECVDMDNSDFKTLRTLFKDSEQMHVLTKAAILNALDESEKKSEKKK
jgi:hypothetical protein